MVVPYRPALFWRKWAGSVFGGFYCNSMHFGGFPYDYSGGFLEGSFKGAFQGPSKGSFNFRNASIRG